MPHLIILAPVLRAQVMNAAVMAHLLKQGFRMSAISLEEEMAGQPSSTGAPPQGTADLNLWHWYSVARWGRPTSGESGSPACVGGPGSPISAGDKLPPRGPSFSGSAPGDSRAASSTIEELRAQLRVAQERSAALQAQVSEQSRRLAGHGAVAGSAEDAAGALGSRVLSGDMDSGEGQEGRSASITLAVQVGCRRGGVGFTNLVQWDVVYLCKDERVHQYLAHADMDTTCCRADIKSHA